MPTSGEDCEVGYGIASQSDYGYGLFLLNIFTIPRDDDDDNDDYGDDDDDDVSNLCLSIDITYIVMSMSLRIRSLIN